MNERNKQLRVLRMNAEYYRLKARECKTFECREHFKNMAHLMLAERNKLLEEK